MDSLYNIKQIEFLNNYWDNTDYRKYEDRSYQFAILKNNEFNITEILLKWFEKKTNKKLISYNHNLIIHRFFEGDYFGLHTDNVETNDKNRCYVIGFHINDNYEGGEYKLYNPDFIIDKTPGVPYCFESNRLHEIKKIKKGIRKSALIFINYEDIIKNIL